MGHDFGKCALALGVAETGDRTHPPGDAPEAPRSNGQGGRVIGSATAKRDRFAITINGTNTIGVIVAVDLERGAPVSKGVAGPQGHGTRQSEENDNFG